MIALGAALIASGAQFAPALADDSTPAPVQSPSASASTGTPTPSPSAQPNVQSDQATVTPTPTPTPTITPPPDNYSPAEGVIFNRPMVASARYTIRNHILRTINSVPAGGTIRAASFSVNDDGTVDALLAAKKRGVSVQVIANAHVTKRRTATYSPSFVRLQKALGTGITEPGVTDDRVSFAKTCYHSCRGVSGNMHQKLFLFSQAGTSRYVTITGSANITLKAAAGQWNHMQTYNRAATFAAYMGVFDELKVDKTRGAKDIFTDTAESWIWPRRSTSASNDPMLSVLNKVKCKGVGPTAGRDGRTMIRIGMYAWYQSRGNYLAKKVRSLWNAGCDVAVEYAISSNETKKILYSAAGRGRIPMRQIVTKTRGGELDKYTHNKFLAISGVYGSDDSHHIVLAGTTNWANLGLYSDEMTQILHDRGLYRDYLDEFMYNWRQGTARAPSPVRTSTGAIEFGEGNLSNLDTD